MAFVPGFVADVFFSYAHTHNQPVAGPPWNTAFQMRLEHRLAQLLDSEPVVWREVRLDISDDFAAAIDERIRRAAVLLPIVSPAYSPPIVLVSRDECRAVVGWIGGQFAGLDLTGNGKPAMIPGGHCQRFRTPALNAIYS